MRTEGSNGDDSAENHQKTTGHQQRSAANALTEDQSKDGTEETTKLITGSDSTTEDRDVGSVSGLGHAWRRRNGGGEGSEFLSELHTGDDTRHQTLIVTEQREADDRGEGDGQMKALAPQTGGCRPHLERMT